MKKLCLMAVAAMMLVWGMTSLATADEDDNDHNRIEASNTGAKTIDKHSHCRVITNGSGKHIFVPTRGSAEWYAFVAHPPAGVSVVGCSGGTGCAGNAARGGNGDCPGDGGWSDASGGGDGPSDADAGDADGDGDGDGGGGDGGGGDGG